jgi:hypothetical protein
MNNDDQHNKPSGRDAASVAGTIFGLVLFCGINAMGLYLLWPTIRAVLAAIFG